MDTDTERRTAGLLIAGIGASFALLLFFAWLAGELLEGDTAAFDLRVRTLVHAHASGALTQFMRFVSMAGAPSALAIPGIAALVLLWRSGRRRAAVLFLITMAGAGALDAVLKYSFGRQRPESSFFGTPIPNSPSFPSGHALFSACYFAALGEMAASRARRRAVRVAVWSAAAAVVACIGFSRVYLGVHYPSDVVAGYTAAAVWLRAVKYGERILLHRRGGRPEAKTA